MAEETPKDPSSNPEEGKNPPIDFAEIEGRIGRIKDSLSMIEMDLVALMEFYAQLHDPEQDEDERPDQQQVG
jgi:hypothetical protein